jgi:hypothetical protein
MAATCGCSVSTPSLLLLSAWVRKSSAQESSQTAPSQARTPALAEALGLVLSPTAPFGTVTAPVPREGGGEGGYACLLSAVCPPPVGPAGSRTRFAANGDAWMEARTRKAVVERDMAAKKLDDDVVFPNVQPPPMATQLQNLGGGSRPLSLVLSASTTSSLPSCVGPGAETETGLDNKSAVALRSTPHPAADGGGWRRGQGAITTNVFTRACPSSTPAQPTQLSKRICGALTSAKGARRATPSSRSPLVHQGWEASTATHEAGGTPLGSSYFLGPP